MNAYNSGTPTAVADLGDENGTFIFKMVNGPQPSDIFYGMINITKIVPGISVDYEYRVGTSYSHWVIFK
jgi:hypothetical protein